MFSKFIQLERKSSIAFLLAMMMGIVMATPALAWFPEEEVLTVHCLPCRVIRGESGEAEVYQFKRVPKSRRHTVAKSPVVRPSIEKAELMRIVIQ